jgi:DNA-binding NarL/FixJ family response regulator
VKRRTLAEAPEFLVEEAESSDDLEHRIVNGAFDIVICDEALIGSSERQWMGDVKRQSNFLSLGYIFIISEVTSEERREDLSQLGTHTFLDAKCTGTDIATAIATVFDPRHRRVFRRVSIPGTHARIRVGAVDLGADVINVSVAGMLCELASPDDFNSLVHLADVAIRLPVDYDSEVIDGIRARMLRFQVVTRRANHAPERIRTAWQFIDVPKDSYGRLDMIVKTADDEAPPESRSL